MISLCNLSLQFSACYVYSPRGVSPTANGSRRLRERVKGCDARWLARYCHACSRAAFEHHQYGDLFGPNVILIPVPRSVLSSCERSWAAGRFLLRFCTRVSLRLSGPDYDASARCASRPQPPCVARPTVVEHYNSFLVDSSLRTSGRIVLVDDIVTRGRTLLAASMRVREHFSIRPARCPSRWCARWAWCRTLRSSSIPAVARSRGRGRMRGANPEALGGPVTCKPDRFLGSDPWQRWMRRDRSSKGPGNSIKSMKTNSYVTSKLSETPVGGSCDYGIILVYMP